MTSKPETKPALPLRGRLARIDQAWLVLVLFVLLVVLGALLNDRFLTASNFLNFLRLAAPFAILALGQAIVVMGKGIDLSSAAVALGFSQATLAFLAQGMPEAQAIILAIVLAAVVGVINGWLVAYVEVPALFATLATGLLTIAFVNIFLVSQNFYQLGDDTALRAFAFGSFFGVPKAILIAAVVFVLAWMFIKFTASGKLIRAMGDNPQTARSTGAPVRQLQMLSYVISSLLAMLAGFVLVSGSGSAQTVLSSFHPLLFTALTVTVIGGVSLSGGRGTVFGIFAGTLFVAALNNLLILQSLSAPLQDMIRGAVLLAAIWIDSWLHPRDEETAKSGEL
ncbi:ABC transporter permease [Microbacterium sp. No. 7]|uniref:ABC transporter permease n=1 Tax=Microbacterium sp. No. 7 TaxID=1714373 RepID=UPI0018D17077|nr:ABC transporter permease [Microbacterium sp. No. 7]